MLMLEKTDYRRRLSEYDETVLSYVEAGVPSPIWSAPVMVRRGGFVGDLGADVGVLDSGLRARIDMLEAGAYAYGFTGVTRDQYGSPLGGVNVRLFRTSNSLLVATTTSDSAGNFTVATPYYPDAHFLVYQKTGSPDVQGASVFTLVGT